MGVGFLGIAEAAVHTDEHCLLQPGILLGTFGNVQGSSLGCLTFGCSEGEGELGWDRAGEPDKWRQGGKNNDKITL